MRLVVAGLGALLVLQQTGESPRLDPAAEFPMHDSREAFAMRSGLAAVRADETLRTDPTHPDVLASLLRRGLYRQAAEALRGLPAQPRERITASMTAIRDATFPSRPIAEPGDFEAILEALRPALARLAEWPPEDAAAVALPFLRIEESVLGINKRWPNPDERVRHDYAGTQTARLLEVDRIAQVSNTVDMRSTALDRYWRDHPRSVDGAKALYLKGFDLAANGGVRGVDPSARLAEVAAIVQELESGRHPRCEWTERAPELILTFSFPAAPLPAFRPGSIDRMLDIYRNFARSHSRLSPGVMLQNDGIGYVVTGKMADLHAVKGDRFGGVERELDDLEQHALDPAYVRLIRAEYIAWRSTAGEPAARAAMKEKAIEKLMAVAAESSAYTSRKALATLASLAFFTKDFDQAQRYYERYVAAYPSSGWSWLAAVRLGQVAELTERWQRAADAYAQAATTYAEQPLARVTAEAGHGRALETLGRVADARDAYRRAAAGWDERYGEQNTIGQLPLTRERLLDRIAQLDRWLRAPGGVELARANRLIEMRRYAESLDVLRRYARAHRPESDTARALRHRAMFELALSQAAIEAPARDERAAIRLLEELSREPFSFHVAAGELARAILLSRDVAAATDIMTRALDRLERSRRAAVDTPPASPLEADIRAIRALMFQPAGQLEQMGRHWNGYSFPDAVPPFVVVNPEFRVKLLRQPYQRHRLIQPLPGAGRVLWLSTDETQVLAGIIDALGGSRRLAWTVATDTPNRPIGPSLDILAFWNCFFPVQPGHWLGWELETYPMLGDLEFQDEARTTAHISFTVGYAGGYMVVKKVNGVWKAIALEGRWIT